MSAHQPPSLGLPARPSLPQSSLPPPGPTVAFLDHIRSLLSHLSISASKLAQYVTALFHRSRTFRYSLYLVLVLGPAFLLIRRIRQRYLNKYPPSSFSSPLLPSYHYVIVGAGSAGCVLANRLSEDASKTVLLIESGGSDDSLDVNVPAAALKLQLSPLDWQRTTVKQQHACQGMNNAVNRWPSGRVLGGSSSINYMLWVRGEREDYDAWQEMGCKGWGWADVLPYFNRVEAAPSELLKDSGGLRGASGPMRIEQLRDVNVNTRAFITACQQQGLQYVNDYNGQHSAGVSLSQYTTHRGRRWNSASGYLLPALNRTNLHVLTHAQVIRVVFDRDNRAERVIFRRGATVTELRAASNESVAVKGEVILSAGAVGSPHLLMLSGVGDREHLSQHNIRCVSHLPGVGQNLQDHLETPLIYATKLPTLSTKDENLTALAQLYVQGRGPLASCMVEAFAFVNSSEEYDPEVRKATGRAGLRDVDKTRSDIQLHYLNGTLGPSQAVAFNYREDLSAKYFKLAGSHYTHGVLATLVKPQSVGSVTLSNADPFNQPLIDPRYLSHPDDVRALTRSCRLAAAIFDRPALQANHLTLDASHRLLSSVLAPHNPHDPITSLDAWWEHYCRHVSNTLYHPVGTCRMGRAEGDVMAVVDVCGRVRGVSGLRVVDASVMPRIVSGNTNWPVMMIAEKMAASIRDTSAEPVEKRQVESTRAKL